MTRALFVPRDAERLQKLISSVSFYLEVCMEFSLNVQGFSQEFLSARQVFVQG
jgi:hypothetical protein